MTNNGIKELNIKLDAVNSELKVVSDKTAVTTNDINLNRKKIDALEQYTRRNNLRFFGVPEVECENTEELVINIINAILKLQVDINDIERSHRVGAPSEDPKKYRAIIVKFCSYRVRSEVYKNKKNLKRKNIVIREDLTGERVQMLSAATLKYGRRNLWTQDGRIKWIDQGRVFVAGYGEI